MKQPIEADFDILIRDADVEITFKPMMSHYSFPLLAERRKSLRELAFDMPRRAILVIVPRVMSKLWHSVLLVPRSRASSSTEFRVVTRVTPKKTANRAARLAAS